MKKHTIKFLGKIFAGLLFFSIGIGLLGLGTDHELVLTREVESDLPVETIDKALRNLNNWALWHFDLQETKALDGRGEPYAMRDQTALTGEWIRMWFVPTKKEWKRFQVDANILEYTPKKRLIVHLISDSKNKISKLFSSLIWKVELETRPNGTRIRTEIRGMTQGWRARFFGRVAERILMNQVLFVNASKLAELKQPLNLNPLPQSQQ